MALMYEPTSIQYRCSAPPDTLTRHTPTAKRCGCSYFCSGPFAHSSNSGGGWLGSNVEYQSADSVPTFSGGPIPELRPRDLSPRAARWHASTR